MTTWELILWIAGGIIFTASVLDSVVRLFKWYRQGKQQAGEHVDTHIRDVIREDRKTNCPFLTNYERDLKLREREIDLLKESILKELKPINDSLTELRKYNKIMYHSLMNDLQIKLRAIYARFERRGTMSKPDQTNWDKYYSSYVDLGGNSDIKRMDELIQKVRAEITLGKALGKKKIEKDDDDEVE